MAGGKCRLVTAAGPAEDRDSAEEDGTEMFTRRTKEQSPGGGPGMKVTSTTSRRRSRAGDGTFWRSKGRDSDESQCTRFDYVVESGFQVGRNPAPTDYTSGSNEKLSTSW